jgi:hypothetical protein
VARAGEASVGQLGESERGKPVGEERTEMSTEWMSVGIGFAVWGWDAIRAAWNAMTWRDGLLLLIFVGVWGARRNGRRVLVRLHKVRETIDDMNELNRLFLQRRDERVDKIERILGVN